MYNTTCQICGKTTTKIVSNLYPLKVCAACVLAVDKSPEAEKVVSQIQAKLYELRRILAEASTKAHKELVESKERIN